MYVAGAGAGIGHHRAVPAGQLPVPGLAGVTAASPGVRYGATPEATSRQPSRAAASAASRRSRISSRPTSSRLVHTPVPVSTWNRISSCRTPGSPPSIRTSSGPASTAAPVDGSSSTNSSSTPSVTTAGRAHRPRRAAGHRHGPSRTARSGHYHDHLGRRAGLLLRQRQPRPSALASPAAAWAAGISGHSRAASVTETAACTAAASARGQRDDLPGCLPGCVQRLPGRDRHGPGHRLVLPVVPDTA